MTRKDYEMIAEAIEDAYKVCDASNSDTFGVTEAAHALADQFQTDNPRFDRDRFLKACGVN